MSYQSEKHPVHQTHEQNYDSHFVHDAQNLVFEKKSGKRRTKKEKKEEKKKKKKLTETGRRKLERQKSWQEKKDAKLYPDLFKKN